MATINIRRVGLETAFYDILALTICQDVSDPFYRYKMEKLQSKVEGKGNGIKTVIVNLSSVAHSLSRPPSRMSSYNTTTTRALTINRCHQIFRL